MTPTEEARAAAGVRRVGLNVASLLAAYVLPRVFTVGAIVLAARVLGTERFGAYGAAAAFVVILSLLGTLGMHPLLVRDLAREPARAPRLVRAAHIVKSVAVALMLALVYALSRWMGFRGEALVAAMLLGVASALGAYSENLSAFFHATERMHVWAEASALSGLVTGLLGALLVLVTRSIPWFCAAAVAGQAAALVWLLVRAPAGVRWGEPSRGSDVARLARALLPFAVGFVALTLHYKMDVLVLQKLRGAVDVGLYTAAYKFVDVFHALVLVGVTALFPRLARASTSAADRVKAGERWAGTSVLEIVMLGAIPVGGALHLAAGPSVAALFGAQYAAAVPSVAWLALGLPALAVNLLGGYLLGAAHRMGWMAGLYAFGLALKTALDLFLMPRMGPAGAAMAMAAAEATLAVGVLIVLARVAHVAPSLRASLAGAGALALIGAARLVDDPSGGILTAAGYLIAVLSLYALAGLVGPRERRVLTRAMRDRQVLADSP